MHGSRKMQTVLRVLPFQPPCS